MKRFYKDVAMVAENGAFTIQLDGRPVRTPARAALALPHEKLAAAIADEWRAQGDMIDPGSMPFTGLANGAIDQIAPDRENFAAGIARYGEGDLLCYRADGPAELIAREAAAWDPLLEWAQHRYDIAFRVTRGIIPVEQPADTLEQLRATVAALGPFTLAGLSTLVALSGSLVCGLAIVEGGYDADAIWTASEVDEMWEVEQWGEDAEAAARATRRKAEFAMAHAFCGLAQG